MSIASCRQSAIVCATILAGGAVGGILEMIRSKSLRFLSMGLLVTLAVAERIAAGADEALRSLPGLPLDCRIGAAMLFGSRRPMLVRLIVPSAALLTLHRAVDDICAPHAAPEPMPNSRPGAWTPHVTLTRRLTPDQVGSALTAIGGRDIRGSFAGLRHWHGDVKQAVTLQPPASH